MMSSSRIRNLLFFTAAYVLLLLSVDALGRPYLDADMLFRIKGMLMGAWVVAWANADPKTLVPLDKLTCDPARDQSLRRLAAWVMVLGGVAYMLAFAFAPLAIAGTLAMCLLAPAVVVVGGITARCAWRRRSAG